MTMTPGENPGSSSFPAEDAAATVEASAYARPAAALSVSAIAFAVAAALAWPGLRAPLTGLTGWAATLVEAAITLAPLAIGAIVAARVGGPIIARALGLRIRPIDLLLGVLVAVVARAVMEVVLPTEGSLRPTLDAGDAEATAALVAAIVVLVVLSPLVEELFFRGAVQRALQAQAAAGLSPRVAASLAIAVTTIGFVVLHAVPYGAQVPLSVIVPPLLIGVGAGTLTATTGRISAGLIAHVLFNLGGVILLLI